MKACRICQSKLGEPFLNLGNSPLANSYLKKEELNSPEIFYPLRLYLCNKCFLVQLNEFGSPDKIFSDDYPYYSSFSASWLNHAREYAGMITEKLNLDKNSYVVEVASNDGYLLQYFKERDIPVLGIEPSAGTANAAIEKGIPTDITFFNIVYADKMHKSGKLADLMIGNNVLAHNPDLNGFAAAFKIALKPAGIITLEFPHLLSILEHNQFDTIYHEHYSYFSFFSVNKLFNLHGLEIFDVDELTTHGGSLRIYLKHPENHNYKITGNVNRLLKKEENSGLLEINTYLDFRNKVESTKWKLLNFLIQEKQKRKKIIGYGAPAKGNTLLNYCGIRTDFLDYTVDRSPYKQNLYLPGTHIPIKSPEIIKEDKPDYLLILPWNIKTEIIEKMGFIREWGGRFIVPIPEVEIL